MTSYSNLYRVQSPEYILNFIRVSANNGNIVHELRENLEGNKETLRVVIVVNFDGV
jgi:predicted transcriptional regulator